MIISQRKIAVKHSVIPEAQYLSLSIADKKKKIYSSILKEFADAKLHMAKMFNPLSHIAAF